MKRRNRSSRDRPHPVGLREIITQVFRAARQISDVSRLRLRPPERRDLPRDRANEVPLKEHPASVRESGWKCHIWK